MESLMDLQERAVERVAKAPALGPMEASDAEDTVADWLEDHSVSGGWDLAPVLVQAGLDTVWLDQVADIVAANDLEGAIRWLTYTVETETLMNEIQDATGRIMHLVGAAKQYSQLDRAPYTEVDVHELLDSTLIMMAAKIGPDVTVVKDYDRTLPKIPAYAAELNQVWTNLIDNAVSAMDHHGTLTIRTGHDRDKLQVEIGDTGSGIPKDIQGRIFDPFFTTKPVGEVPGDTKFMVWLPFTAQNQGDETPEPAPQEQETTS
jgi:signal transduction histidine kinase